MEVVSFISESISIIFAFTSADESGSVGEDYEDSDEDDYDNDDDEDDSVIGRKPFPFFTPVTPYPPVYCMSKWFYPKTTDY